MEDIRKDNTLPHEISADYRNFRRDTLFISGSISAVFVGILLIMQAPWYLVVFPVLFTVIKTEFNTIFFRQLFVMSFNDKERKISFRHSQFWIIKNIEIPYHNLKYQIISEYGHRESGVVLKLYHNERLLFRAERKKYGWTNGLVEEAIKMVKYRNIKRID